MLSTDKKLGLGRLLRPVHHDLAQGRHLVRASFAFYFALLRMLLLAEHASKLSSTTAIHDPSGMLRAGC